MPGPEYIDEEEQHLHFLHYGEEALKPILNKEAFSQPKPVAQHRIPSLVPVSKHGIAPDLRAVLDPLIVEAPSDPFDPADGASDEDSAITVTGMKQVPLNNVGSDATGSAMTTSAPHTKATDMLPVIAADSTSTGATSDRTNEAARQLAAAALESSAGTQHSDDIYARPNRQSSPLKLNIPPLAATAQRINSMSTGSATNSPSRTTFTGAGDMKLSPFNRDGGMGPNATRLPSISQMVPEVASSPVRLSPHQQTAQQPQQQQMQQQQRSHPPPPPFSRNHSHSISSVTSTSSQPPIHSHLPTAYPSPTLSYPFGVASPTSTAGDSAIYSSPTRHQTSTSYPARREYVAMAAAGARPMPRLVHQSTSSSCSSSGTMSSSVDGNSTARTTPIESGPGADVAQQRHLPPPIGMPAEFRCTHEGCNAGTFQTQYLLSSHENVHSQDRPHYCPVPQCPRGVGGEGFKRKNEMIRHGLVHASPGFVCPFCTDRDNTYSYPRSDNLLRHVKAHHTDKPRDDPRLRDVLDQGGKKRRRKTLSDRP